jgi:transcription antitermination factor NusG
MSSLNSSEQEEVIGVPARPKQTWAVAQVFSKRAGRIRLEAEEANCGTFLPTYARVQYRDGKRSSSERQLLPGYLFVKLGDDDRARIAELEGVYRILPGSTPSSDRLEREMAHLVIGHASGRWNEVAATPEVERRRRRRRRPRPGRRWRMRQRAEGRAA